MSSRIAIEEGAAPRGRGTMPKDASTLATLALAVGLAVVAATWGVAEILREVLAGANLASGFADTVLLIFSIASLALLVPAYKAMQTAKRGRAARLGDDIIEARVEGASARTWCWFTFGYAAAVTLVLLAALFIVANNVAVGKTFFYLPLIASSFGLVLSAFWTNG
jgi:polar amino acid transport system permease protein